LPQKLSEAPKKARGEAFGEVEEKKYATAKRTKKKLRTPSELASCFSYICSRKRCIISQMIAYIEQKILIHTQK